MISLVEAVPSQHAIAFAKWLITGEYQIDSKSRDKAYQLWDSSLLQTIQRLGLNYIIMKLIKVLLLSFVLIVSMFSCKKTSNGESVPVWNKIYKIEVVVFEKDMFSGRLVENKEKEEITAESDEEAAEKGFIAYLAHIKTFCKLNENDCWISIPKFYYVYDENGHILSRIKGDKKQELIEVALSEDDIQAYKETLPMYHFEYSALVQD